MFSHLIAYTRWKKAQRQSSPAFSGIWAVAWVAFWGDHLRMTLIVESNPTLRDLEDTEKLRMSLFDNSPDKWPADADIDWNPWCAKAQKSCVDLLDSLQIWCQNARLPWALQNTSVFDIQQCFICPLVHSLHLPPLDSLFLQLCK